METTVFEQAIETHLYSERDARNEVLRLSLARNASLEDMRQKLCSLAGFNVKERERERVHRAQKYA